MQELADAHLLLHMAHLCNSKHVLRCILRSAHAFTTDALCADMCEACMQNRLREDMVRMDLPRACNHHALVFGMPPLASGQNLGAPPPPCRHGTKHTHPMPASSRCTYKPSVRLRLHPLAAAGALHGMREQKMRHLPDS